MKKILITVTIAIMIISISACSLKTSSNTKKADKAISSAIKIEKSKVNSCLPLDKLPSQYPIDLAVKNGDVVNTNYNSANVDKLDKFIEHYHNKKTKVGDMVRTIKYTTEGATVISDLIVDSEGVKLLEDMTRDGFSSTENRKITEFKIVDIFARKKSGSVFYTAKTDKGEEIDLFYRNINEN